MRSFLVNAIMVSGLWSLDLEQVRGRAIGNSKSVDRIVGPGVCTNPHAIHQARQLR